MADNTINVRIKDRSDTEANWTSKNPVLLKGERAITDGTAKYKIGDGKNTWSALPYYEAMTSADRTKLNSIASGANKTIVDSSLSTSSTNPVQNKVVNSALAGKSNTSHTHNYVKDAGDNSSTTFAYSKAGMNYDEYEWLAGWNGHELRTVEKYQFATAGHTHFMCQSIEPSDQNNGDIWFKEE